MKMLSAMTWLAEERSRLDRFREGDPAILSEVYAVYARDVSRVLANGFSFSSGGRFFRFHGYRAPYDLDDLLQETFVRAFTESARQRYDGLRPYRAYLLTIARNLVIDQLRSGARRPELLSEDVDEETEADALPRPASPEIEAMEAQLREMIAAFKEGLSESERQVFELRFEQSETRARVTELTGLSAQQVRSRELRLREALLERLQGSGYGPTTSLYALCAIMLLEALR